MYSKMLSLDTLISFISYIVFQEIVNGMRLHDIIRYD
ncbi:hypothetical protein EUBDOL_01692 [Amedibacillus dolichus DSM 3991]|uniref:Uncharacterized protein n=1 Tax=Amedibacillus dolichus DSM 3991 TaxID=428127 RepID=A8RE52_9FIRM|nr:hypothetical protein EUBDOL_01692 [Amedibacillus dolichus DSM 3991]